MSKKYDWARIRYNLQDNDFFLIRTTYVQKIGQIDLNASLEGLLNEIKLLERSKQLRSFFVEFLTPKKDLEDVLNYIDDIIIYNNNFSDHVKSLKAVFQRFERFNMTIKLKKCSFLDSSTEAFGYVVNKDGYKPNPARVEKLLKIEVPASKKDLKKSLASFAYYRQSIKNYGKLTGSLYDRMKEACKFVVDEKLKKEWNLLLKSVADTVLLTKPKFCGKFVLRTDSSTHSIECVLREAQGGQDRILLVDSKCLTSSQIKYPISQKELFAVYFFFRKYKDWLIFERSFTVYADNVSVYYSLKNAHKYDIN